MATRWERLAEFTGGVVAGLAAPGGAVHAEVVFAATPTGVFRSSDGGQTWTPAGQLGAAPMAEALAISPAFSDDGVVFAATRSGLYRSADGGDSWTLTLSGGRMLTLAVSPTFATDQVVFVGSEADGLLRSDDGGVNWTSANPGLLDVTALTVALSPSFGADGVGLLGSPSGLYRTRNGGKAWRAVEAPVEEPAVQCLLFSPNFAVDRVALAGTEEHGLLRSADGGATWVVVKELIDCGVTALVAINQTTFTAATTAGFAVSNDSGQTWTTNSASPDGILALAALGPGPQPTIVAGLAGDGVARSIDLGQSWTASNVGLRGRLHVGLALSPDFARDRALYLAGLYDGALASTDGGQTWQSLADADGLVALGVATPPMGGQSGELLCATASGVRRRTANGEWSTIWRDETGVASLVAIGPASSGGVAPMFVACQGGGAHFSGDGGDNWRAVGSEFADAEIVSAAFSPDFNRDGVVFVGTHRDRGDQPAELVLWRSADGGHGWERWLTAEGAATMPIAVPRRHAATGEVFVGVGSRVMRPMPGSRTMTPDGPRPIWRAAELGADVSITSLVATAESRHGSTLFAGTNVGVYVSRDGGGAFRPWRDGLDPRGVVALAVSPDFARDRLVYALGLGGIIWRRRD